MATMQIDAPIAERHARATRPTPAAGRAWYENRTTVRAVTWLAFLFYATVGLWMLYGVHFAIGDEIARSAAARYVVASRDPHLAAIGFVWLPLPSFVQIPFVWILGPFGLGVAAGPLSTAVAAALTIPVLIKVMRALDVHPALATAILAIYALNPVTVFYAGIGMSEALFFLFLALAVLGYVSWLRDRRPTQLGTLAFALAGAMLVRYETIALIVLFGIAVALQARKGRRLLTASMTMIPGLYALFLWMSVSWLLVGNAFFFASGFSGGKPPLDAPWLPHGRSIANGVKYALDRSARIGGAFLVIGLIIVALALFSLLRARSLSTVQGLVIVAAGAVFPGQVAFLMSRNGTWGNARYFTPLLILSATGAAWLLRGSRNRHERRWRPLAVGIAVVAVLLAGVLGATVSFADPKVSAVESESYVFGRLPGLNVSRTAGAFPLGPWKTIARLLDGRLRGNDLVIADTNVAFPAVLLSRHPNLFMIVSDRDYERLVAARLKPITYAIIAEGQASLGHDQEAVRAVLAFAPEGSQWVKIGHYSVADVYHLESALPPKGP